MSHPRERTTTSTAPSPLEAEEPLDGAREGVGNTIARFDLSALAEVGQKGQEAAMVATLVGNSELCRKRFRLTAGKQVAGRIPEVAVFLDHPSVSRHHAIIEVTADKVKLSDNKSSNGTFVNGTRIKQVVLSDGDVILFGRVRLVVALGVPTPRSRPAPAPASARARPATRAVPAPSDAVAEAESPTILGIPAEGPKLQVLEDERRQLAILFQLSLRYLAEPVGSDPGVVLFEVLDRIVPFEAAFIAIGEDDGPRFKLHPHGVQLSQTVCARIYREADPKATRIREGMGDELTVGTLGVRSRAVIPLGGTAFLVLLSSAEKLYSPQHDYLSLIGNLYEAASSRLASGTGRS